MQNKLKDDEYVPSPNTTIIGTPHSIKQILEFHHPEILAKWDGWDFKVISTGNNLDDDAAQHIVYLKNKNGEQQRVIIYS